MSIPSSSPLHKYALEIAGKNTPVFPCKPDKSPYTPRGFKDATTNPGQVTALFTKHPDAFIGMPTGVRSGVSTVDVDRLEALEELEKLKPELVAELRKTLTIRTPSGGLHFYLQHTEGITNRTGTLPDGIDIRGEGGYVIAPPSPGYKVVKRAPIRSAPEVLLEKIREKPTRSTGTRGAVGADGARLDPDSREPIPEGCRNRTLASILGKRRAEGCKYEELLALGLFVNRRRCEPALPEAEVEQIARSVARYPKGTGAPAVSRETRAAIDRYQATVLHGRAWNRIGDLSIQDILKVIISKARRFGWLDEDGNVIVSISYRELALEAATRLETAYKAAARAKQAGLLASANAERKRGQAGAFKLLIPGRAYPEHSDLARGTSKRTNDGRSVPPLRAPLLRHHAPGYWRIGKGGSAVVHYLESLPGSSATLAEIAAHLGVRRWRDLYRMGPNPRGRVWRLAEAGVVTVSGDRVSLVDNYLDKIDQSREEGGEFAARREQIRRFNIDRKLYHGGSTKTDHAPTFADLDIQRRGRQEKMYVVALEAFRTDGSGARRNLELFMDGALQNLEYLVNSVLAFDQVPREEWEAQREWWREPVLQAGSVVARASEAEPEASEEWKSYPLDCACDGCLYPTPKYASSYVVGTHDRPDSKHGGTPEGRRPPRFAFKVRN